MVAVQQNRTRWAIVALLLVLISNLLLYRLPAPFLPTPHEAKGVVFGSLMDLMIIAPLLILYITRSKRMTFKRLLTWIVLGVVAARLIIPLDYFTPFRWVPYVAIGVESIFVLMEIGLLILLITYFPRIIQEVKRRRESPLFSFPMIVEETIRKHPFLRLISAECVMFYYAFATWKQKPQLDDKTFTLHHNTSLVAFYVMLIHAIVIETLGIHWWLHEKSMILSLVLLIVNVYSLIYFLGDLQVIRLNPLVVKEEEIQVSLGLGKRMTIPFQEIDRIVWDEEASTFNLKDKQLIDFMARDFEGVTPQCVIIFKRPLRAIRFLGFEKEYQRAAFRVDDLKPFRALLEHQSKAPKHFSDDCTV